MARLTIRGHGTKTAASVLSQLEARARPDPIKRTLAQFYAEEKLVTLVKSQVKRLLVCVSALSDIEIETHTSIT